MKTRAVLFDWRGTLVTTPGEGIWVQAALELAGHPAGAGDVDDVLARIYAANGPDHRLDTAGMDTDAAFHRSVFMEVLRDAGLDRSLSDALYALESDPRFNIFAVDVAATLRALRTRGVAVAVISDIHFDLRPHFTAAGMAGLVDVFTLSFEQGVQKPDPAMFLRTLAQLGVHADEALMVGDRSRPDGAAVEHGIVTLLLPPLVNPSDVRLHRVLALCE